MSGVVDFVGGDLHLLFSFVVWGAFQLHAGCNSLHSVRIWACREAPRHLSCILCGRVVFGSIEFDMGTHIMFHTLDTAHSLLQKGPT